MHARIWALKFILSLAQLSVLLIMIEIQNIAILIPWIVISFRWTYLLSRLNCQHKNSWSTLCNFHYSNQHHRRLGLTAAVVVVSLRHDVTIVLDQQKHPAINFSREVSSGVLWPWKPKCHRQKWDQRVKTPQTFRSCFWKLEGKKVTGSTVIGGVNDPKQLKLINGASVEHVVVCTMNHIVIIWLTII